MRKTVSYSVKVITFLERLLCIKTFFLKKKKVYTLDLMIALIETF